MMAPTATSEEGDGDGEGTMREPFCPRPPSDIEKSTTK